MNSKEFLFKVFYVFAQRTEPFEVQLPVFVAAEGIFADSHNDTHFRFIWTRRSKKQFATGSVLLLFSAKWVKSVNNSFHCNEISVLQCNFSVNLWVKSLSFLSVLEKAVVLL